MDANENDASQGETGQHPPTEPDDSAEWVAIETYRGRTPPTHDEVWTIRSVSRRFAHGERATDIVERPTGEPMTRGEPHWYVTAKRDQFPQTKHVTAEYHHSVVPDTTALAAWFYEAEELVQ